MKAKNSNLMARDIALLGGEDYHGNISDVYKAYGMSVDPRDRSRGVRIKTQ